MKAVVLAMVAAAVVLIGGCGAGSGDGSGGNSDHAFKPGGGQILCLIPAGGDHPDACELYLNNSESRAYCEERGEIVDSCPYQPDGCCQLDSATFGEVSYCTEAWRCDPAHDDCGPTWEGACVEDGGVWMDL